MGKILSFLRVSEAHLRFVALACIILFGTLEPFLLSKAYAVSTTGFVRLDRMLVSTNTGGTVCLTPQTTNTEAKVLVTFPGTGTQGASSFGVNATNTNWTITTTNIPTGSTAWVGIGTATTVSGATVTFPSGDLVVGTQYCFNFSGTSTLSTTTTAGSNLTGSIVTETSGNAPIDTVNFALATVNGTTQFDTVSVTASVPSTFTFYVNMGSAALLSLPTSGNPNTASVSVFASTNAQNGWLAWIKNTNANSTLLSSSTSDTIPNPGVAFTTGAGNVRNLNTNPGYGVAALTGTGSPTIATEYAGNGSSTFGSLDNTKYEQFASLATPIATSSVTLTFGARASATNKAATDYADTVYVTGAGQF